MGGDRGAYQQRQLFVEDPSLVRTKKEDQWFDRKSIRIPPVALANAMIGFANADGGTLIVGAENSGSVTGIGADTDQLNRLQQAAIDFTSPPVRHTSSLVRCMDDNDRDVDVLVFEVHPSDQVHRNKRDEVYLRIGDQNRRLAFEAVRELTYDKGGDFYDGKIAPGVTLSDLNDAALDQFAKQIGASGDTERALRVRSLFSERDGQRGISWGAVLLFGNVPEHFLPGAHIRFLRYEGIEPRPGTRSNLTFDRRIGGTLPEQIARAQDVMLNQLRQLTRLDEATGRFTTVAELPRFAWLEAIVNAVTHRSYSLQGDHVRVKMFDDRVEVESPGRLPGSVRIDNIRHTRFSRNPRISRVLADLRLVQELNEGMNRMFVEMHSAGLPEPRLQQTDAGFRVTLFTSDEAEQARVRNIVDTVPDTFAPALERLFLDGLITTGQAAELAGVSLPTARRYLRSLADGGLIEHRSRSTSDPSSHWRLPQPIRRRWRPAIG